MRYTPIFEPARYTPPEVPARAGDRRDGAVYRYTPEIELAVNVALATRRPLLVRGLSGCGKSSLAPHVARVLGWRYYSRVITSRTRAQDLLWEVDHLRRLRDAHAREPKDLKVEEYVHPGVLWWAFDPAGAAAQAALAKSPDAARAVPEGEARAVVLLDEIDKADPDIPNNLLVPLGSLTFTVDETGETVSTSEDAAPLLVITTNDERELPGAFLRRCVEVVVHPADADALIAIGELHFPDVPPERLDEIARALLPPSEPGDEGGAEREDGAGAPVLSPAEFLDTVRACRELKIAPGSKEWSDMLRITVWKHGRAPEDR